MWESVKNALTGIKDIAGIEIPGLPADLGSVRDTATTAVEGLTESATGVIDGATTAGEAIDGSLPAVTEAMTEGSVDDATGGAATAVDSAAQSLPDISGLPIVDSPLK